MCQMIQSLKHSYGVTESESLSLSLSLLRVEPQSRHLNIRHQKKSIEGLRNTQIKCFMAFPFFISYHVGKKCIYAFL